MSNFIRRLTGREREEEEERIVKPLDVRPHIDEGTPSPTRVEPQEITPIITEGDRTRPGDIQNKPVNSNEFIEWNYDTAWEDMGTLSRVFDVLRRGQYASANVVRGILHGDSNIAADAWDGLTGREKGNFIDILESYDIPFAPVLGLAMNIGLDPVKYMGGPIGIFKKVAKSEGVNVAKEKVSNLIRGDVPGVGNIGNAVDWLGQAFNPNYKIPGPVADRVWFEHYGFKKDKVYALTNVQKKLGEISPKTKKLMTEWRRTGTRPTDPQAQELLNRGMDLWDEATQTAVNLGIIPKKIVQQKGNKYLPTILNKHIKGWTGDTDILKQLKTPSFAMKQTSKNNLMDWRKLSAHFQDLSKKDNIADIKRAASKKLQSDAFPQFTEESMDAVNAILEKSRGAKQAKSFLHDLSVDYTPVDDFDKLLAMYNNELAQAVRQDNVIDFVLNKSDQAGNWRHVLDTKSQVIGEGQTGVVRVNKLREALDRVDMSKVSSEKAQFYGLLKKELPNKGKFFDLTDDLPDTLVQQIAQDDLLKESVSAYALDTEIMDYLTRAEDLYTPATEGGKLASFYDRMLGKWKRSATILRLPFHLRNAMTNQVRMYQGGMDVSDLATFGKKAAAIQKGGSKKIQLMGETKTADDWLQFWSGKGVRGWGFVGEVDPSQYAVGAAETVSQKEHYIDLASDLLGGDITVKKIRELMGAPTDLGGWVGHVIEDNARISDAMWATKRTMQEKGMSFAQAAEEGAKHSWKHLFQYDQLTDFESNVMKRIMPFYTWMRKNLQLQAEKLITDPVRTKEAYQAMDTLRYLNPQTSREQEFTPDYMQELGFFKLPEALVERFSNSEGRPVYANIDMPWDDLHAVFDHPLRTALSSLTPASIAANLGLNVRNFPAVGMPVEQFEGELVPTPAAATFLPSQLWGLFGMKDMRHPDTGKEVLGMPAKAVQALYDLVPPLREFNNMFPQEGVELEREPKSPWAKLRYVTGMQFRPVDHEQQVLYQKYEREGRLSDLAKYMSQLARPLTTEEMEDYMEN